MTDELRELATFAYECGLVGSVGDVRHGVTVRDGLARGRQAADELVAANVELHRLRKQVDLMARTLQRSAHADRDALIAASLGQDKVDAFSVCTCNAEDETKCSSCGQCSRCRGLCDSEIHPGTRCADCEADEDRCTCEDGFNPTSRAGDE